MFSLNMLYDGAYLSTSSRTALSRAKRISPCISHESRLILLTLQTSRVACEDDVQARNRLLNPVYLHEKG